MSEVEIPMRSLMAVCWCCWSLLRTVRWVVITVIMAIVVLVIGRQLRRLLPLWVVRRGLRVASSGLWGW